MAINSLLYNQNYIATGAGGTGGGGGNITTQLTILTPEQVANGFVFAAKTTYYFDSTKVYNVNGELTLQTTTNVDGQFADVNQTNISRSLFYCNGVYSGSIKNVNAKLVGYTQLNALCGRSKFFYSPRAAKATLMYNSASNFGIGVVIGGWSGTQGEYQESQNIISNNRFDRNFIDIIGYNNLEYSIISQNLSNKSCYGIVMASGNNNVSNNQITECPAPLTYLATPMVVSFETTGTFTINPTNEGHSIIANNTCNHGGDHALTYWTNSATRRTTINGQIYEPIGTVLLEMDEYYKCFFNILGNTWWSTELWINKFTKLSTTLGPTNKILPFPLHFTSCIIGGNTDNAIRNYDANIDCLMLGFNAFPSLVVEGNVKFIPAATSGPLWVATFTTPLTSNTGITGTGEHSIATWTGGNETTIKKYQQYRFWCEKLNSTDKLISPGYYDLVVGTDTAFTALGGIARSPEISQFGKRLAGQPWVNGVATTFNVRISMSTTGTILIANDNGGTYNSTYGITRVERII